LEGYGAREYLSARLNRAAGYTADQAACLARAAMTVLAWRIEVSGKARKERGPIALFTKTQTFLRCG
jgi:hypothetical protein